MKLVGKSLQGIGQRLFLHLRFSWPTRGKLFHLSDSCLLQRWDFMIYVVGRVLPLGPLALLLPSQTLLLSEACVYQC